MKKILLGMILSTSACFAGDPPMPNNAYVFFDRYEGRFSLCMIYENHYYVAQMPIHHPACHCQQPLDDNFDESLSPDVWQNVHLSQQK